MFNHTPPEEKQPNRTTKDEQEAIGDLLEDITDSKIHTKITLAYHRGFNLGKKEAKQNGENS